MIPSTSELLQKSIGDPKIERLPNPDISKLLSDIFSEFPKLAAVHDPDKTKIMFAPPDRAMMGQFKRGQLEYWTPENTGDPEMEHPAPGNTVLEIYNPALKDDPENLKKLVIGDLMHGLDADPQFMEMKKQFANHWNPKAWDFEVRSGRNPQDKSVVDSYIRGYLAPDKDAEYLKAFQAGKPVYSPEQLRILQKMQNYLGFK